MFMFPLGHTVLVGKTGRRYQFSVFNKDQEFLEIEAVYVFLKFHEARPVPLYIGQTDNLKKRLSNHEKLLCVALNGYTHIAIMHVPNGYERLQIETDLIHAYNTPCNKQ